MKCFLKYTFYVVSCFLFLSQCKPKDEVVSDDPKAMLRFSVDTVHFDTIFSTIGSTTQRFWVYNDQKNAVVVSTIQLNDPTNTAYKLIVDGQVGASFTDKKILGKDSLLVLVEALIDPQDKSQPYLVKNQVDFLTNGNTQGVKLISYGQDAFFIDGTYDLCDKVWNDEKAYVVVDSLYVPAGCSLTINEGCKVFFNENAKMVVDGQLIVNGTADSIVRFTSDTYLGKDVFVDYGYWRGIILGENSSGHSLDWVTISNARTGINYHGNALVDSVFDLTINHTKILNMFDNGFSFSGVDVYTKNSLITGAIDQNVLATDGGNYVFVHSTIHNRAENDLNSDVAFVVNDGDGVTSLQVRNCILSGNLNEELNLEGLSNKYISENLVSTLLTDVIKTNSSDTPIFKSVYDFNFELDSLSPGIDKGEVILGGELDLNGEFRDDSPDYGAYEYIKD